MTCELILPCRDEAAALVDLLPRVPPGLAVVVVDNGSSDGTADVARALIRPRSCRCSRWWPRAARRWPWAAGAP
jgi:glycosyltransferase involved in cell wall biosynthesis